jgi:2-dehydro-3-deoxyphosphogluconate aldolase/(4S)-4-hydroxy-2-oxoglutarate aldolase
MNRETLRRCRVLPVITATDVDTTVQLSRTLAGSGLHALEITLRTATGLDCIREVKAELPDMLIAAGTVTNPDELDRALAAGADFAVSPGLTTALLRAARDRDAFLLPGVASASEVMQGMEFGLDTFKLFPAEAVGGIALLKALSGPFPAVCFCPTGGLNTHNFREYLALPNVVCCGGSWMLSPELVSSGDWQGIAAHAADAMRP